MGAFSLIVVINLLNSFRFSECRTIETSAARSQIPHALCMTNQPADCGSYIHHRSLHINGYTEADSFALLTYF